MQKQIKNALILLVAFFALLAVLAILTGALTSLKNVLPAYFIASAALFLASILVWLVSWAILIKGKTTSLLHTVLLGFGCVFGALTPVQIGADALRSVKLKEFGNVRYSESIAASMAVKGIKFLFIALLASLAFLISLSSDSLSPLIKVAMVSGFLVVVVAAVLFLLPFNQKAGLKISRLFQKLAPFFPLFNKLSQYFQKYTAYLKQITPEAIVVVLILALGSLLLEFFAFVFAFLSAGLTIPIYNVLVLFSVLAILERTPFLPRGIGIVEIASFVFLSISSFTAGNFSPSQIATVIILYDLARLVIPTVASLLVYSIFFSTKKD